MSLKACGRTRISLQEAADLAQYLRIAASVPLGLTARPEDHTGAYVLLAAAEQSRAMTGTVIHSDGGWEVRRPAHFYVVAAPTGEQVVLVFTMSPKQGERLGSRDLSIVGSLEFPSCRKEKKDK